MSITKCCVPGCANSSGAKEILHKFPNPERDKELFNTWLYAIGGDILQLENNHIFKYRRVCHLHFEEKYWCRSNRLSKIAVPTKKMPGLSLEKFSYETRPLKSIQTSEELTSKKLTSEKISLETTVLSSIEISEESMSKEPVTITHQMDMQLLPTAVADMKLLPSAVADVQPLPSAVADVQRLPSAVADVQPLPSAVADVQRLPSAVADVQPLPSAVADVQPLPSAVADIQSFHIAVAEKERDSRAIIETFRGRAKESVTAVENVSGKTFTETVSNADQHELTVLVHNETYGTPADKPRPVKQVPNTSSCIMDSTSEENDVKFVPTVTPERLEPTYCEKYKNKEYWKVKLKHILHNTQFCGVCLEADVDMNALTDQFEITDDEKTYRKSLRDIVDKVFTEGGYCPANSQICNNCTKKLIQSYIFIHNAEETSKMLDRHLDELYTKTCYIRNNSLKDANNAQSRIYNVVIALDNKVISENFESSQIKIEPPENPESYQNEKGRIRDNRKLKCVSCNVVLPSHRAWQIHERRAHKQSHRCRICLQSYKTQRTLTTHYKTHLKSRCALCHRTVQDGELLQHLKTRHKHSIHLCTTCNVAFYSAKALGSHLKECHRGEDSKCVTCLQSLSQVELERHQCRFKCPECEEAPCVHHRHLMRYREQMANLAPRAKCAECRYVCTSKEALVAHVNRQHLSLQPHRCASCGHEFYCESDLNKHICTSEIGNEDLHICQYCDKAFSSLYICKRHKKSCKGVQRKYQCDDCPANFDSSKDHMKHRKLKHGQEVLSCSLCDRVFLNDLKRTRHERQAHAQQRGRASFVCVVCQTEFSSKATLELHMRYHGPEANSQVDTLGQSKSHEHKHRRSLTVCEVCGAVISRILFKKHMIAHSMATVSCKTCGKSFQNSTLLRYHQSVHVKSVQCPRCKKLISSAKFWRHFRNHLIQDSLDFKIAAIYGL